MGRYLLLFALVAAVVTILRRPDAVLNAQFWAEDGKFWYADAYHIGPVQALLLPRDGYFQTISRIGGALAQPVPLVAAPLVMNGLAILIQVLPVILLVSPRLAAAIPSMPLRIGLAMLWLLIPNGAETHATMTAQHWHLALLSLLLIIAVPPATLPARVTDLVALGISSLSGLPCLFLWPVAALTWWQRRTRWSMAVTGLLGIGVTLQLFSLLLAPDTRSRDPLGASAFGLFELLGGQVVIAGLLGTSGHRWALATLPGWITYLAAAIALVVFAAVAWRGTGPLRLFVLYGLLLFAGALVHPQVSNPSYTRWEALALPDVGGRYWLAATLGLVASLCWLGLCARPPLARAAAMAVLALLAIGVPLSFRYEPFVDLQFATYAAEIEKAAPATWVVIPINPPGWSMTLVKR